MRRRQLLLLLLYFLHCHFRMRLSLNMRFLSFSYTTHFPMDAFKDFFMSAANNLKSDHITIFFFFFFLLSTTAVAVLFSFIPFLLQFRCSRCNLCIYECHSFAAYMNTAAAAAAVTVRSENVLYVVILISMLFFIMHA